MIFKPDSGLVTAVRAAENVEPRRGGVKPSLLILHYTGMSCAAKAVDWLCRAESNVSCHYVVHEEGIVTQMVPEHLRAWHAGVSSWRGECDINSHSIGIEIQNPGHEHGYPDFPEAQMRAVVALSQDIVTRNAMAPENILAHSDVAPERKIDPGEKFDWAMLAKAGLGVWALPSPVQDNDEGLSIGASGERIANAQGLLHAFGYDITRSGVFDEKMAKVLRAFQLHFRPCRVDGRLDRSTELTLASIVNAAGRNVAA